MSEIQLVSRINLLPWREERRKESRAEFGIACGVVAAVALAVWFLIHLYHTQLISRQNLRVDYIQQQIKVLDSKIEEIEALEEEKASLLARIQAIAGLQKNRPLVVRLLDEIVDSLPEGVSLEALMQKNNEIQIDGVAQSNARVSSFMRNISASEWMKSPRLDVIEAVEENNTELSKFTLKFEQVLPKQEDEE